MATTFLAGAGAKAAAILRSPRTWLICFVLLGGALALRTAISLHRAPVWQDGASYSRVDAWISSSECTARKGVMLAVCTPQGVAGIEDYSLADDRGHGLLANLYALASGRAIDRLGLTRLNILLNAASFAGLSIAFYLFGWKVAALLLLLFGIRAAVPGPILGPDAPAAYLAAFNLSLIAVLWALHAPLDASRDSRLRFLAGLAVAIFCLAWSGLIRQPYGIGGFLVSAGVLAARALLQVKASERPWSRRSVPWRAMACIACLAVATFYSTRVLIAAREAIYGVPRGAAILHHGIGHNLYMGLGVDGNRWGIKWNDAHAYEAAKALSPVGYATDGHYRNLWRLYFRIALSEPVEVLGIYAGKLRQSLTVVTNRYLPWATLALLLALACLHRRLAADWVFAAAATWAAFGMVLLQGVLAQPWLELISPGRIAWLCGVVVLAEIGVRAYRRRRQVID